MLMDSANSSSMQSNSSGGDDHEYHSRSLLHNTDPPPPQTTSPLIFSPVDPAFLQPFSDLRDPVFFNWPVSGSDDMAALATADGLGGPSSSSSAQPPPAPPPTARPPPKNPKKRTRASRRAPTTVLTTNTTNFRAMVQEFTGIPAPPFSLPDAATSAYSHLLGAPFRPAAQRMTSMPPQQPNNIFSTSNLVNMGGQTQSQELLGSGQQMGQPDPILPFQSQLLRRRQQQSNSLRLLGYQPDQPPPSNIATNAAFGSIGDDGNNSIYGNTNKE